MRRILFTSYYRDQNPKRHAELLHCLEQNYANKHLHAIVIFLEGKREDFPEIPKNVTVIESQRPTFKDFFDTANTIVGPDDYAIIANTDIYFDRSIRLLNFLEMNKGCVALSRHHYYSKDRIELHNEQWSQDVWIFKGQIKPIKNCEFNMGIPGCDNRIAHEIYQAGYELYNPAKSIKAIHYHMSEVRNYSMSIKIQKPYRPVLVTDIFLGKYDPKTGMLLPQMPAIDDWKPRRREKKTILKTW
jgi:hypothetical protein